MADQQISILHGLANISGLFWGPKEDMCRELLDGSYLLPFEELKDSNRDLEDPLDRIQDLLDIYHESSTLLEDLEKQYVLFFISRKGGIRAPLYHSCYLSQNAPLMGEPARMMAERLKAAGLNLDSTLNELPDHIAVQGEYLYFLLEKGWREDNNRVITEAADFARETMLPWIVMLKDRLIKDEPEQFYTVSAELFCDLLKIISEQA